MEISEVENDIKGLDVNKTCGMMVYMLYTLNILISALCLYLLCV